MDQIQMTDAEAQWVRDELDRFHRMNAELRRRRRAQRRITDAELHRTASPRLLALLRDELDRMNAELRRRRIAQRHPTDA